MAKKGGSKEGVFREFTSSPPVEQKMTSESNKQKIAKIHEIFPAATKDNIAKILQYYEDDENKALDALTRDGGSEALSNWADSGSLKSKNNKNKKKKRKGRKELDLAGSATASFDADDSSSLHSSGNVDVEVEKECSVLESRNGIHDSAEEIKEISQDRLNPEPGIVDSTSKDFAVPTIGIETGQDSNIATQDDSKCSKHEAENPTCISPASDNSDKHDDQSSKKEKYRSFREDSHGKHSSRQRTNSFRRSKTSSLSEDSTSVYNPQNPAVPTKRGFEKCKKDLNRQAISLQRIHSQVEKGLDESSKKLKNAFNDVKKLLDKRQEQVEQELAKTKEDALMLLKSRQDLAVELKRRVDRTSTVTEAEWSELRSDIKQFVTERKYDDELGKTIWFQWSMDSITELINTFGEVQPVRNVYSQRSHAASESVSTSQNNPEPSPSSSLVNEEIGSSTDKNDARTLDAVEDDAPAVKKDVPTHVPRNQPSENRSRVFSNTKFQNNSRGNRGFRGRGFGYPRPNNRNNMSYRNNYNYDYTNDYRNHPHQDRGHDNSMYSNDRNMNSHRNIRRGQNMNFRNNRFRGNSNQQRQNDNVAKVAEPVANDAPALDSATKPNVVNGFSE